MYHPYICYCPASTHWGAACRIDNLPSPCFSPEPTICTDNGRDVSITFQSEHRNQYGNPHDRAFSHALRSGPLAYAFLLDTPARFPSLARSVLGRGQTPVIPSHTRFVHSGTFDDSAGIVSNSKHSNDRRPVLFHMPLGHQNPLNFAEVCCADPL